MLSLSLSAFLFRIWLVLLVHMAMLGLVWHKSKSQTDQNEADLFELLHTSATDNKFFFNSVGFLCSTVMLYNYQIIDWLLHWFCKSNQSPNPSNLTQIIWEISESSCVCKNFSQTQNNASTSPDALRTPFHWSLEEEMATSWYANASALPCSSSSSSLSTVFHNTRLSISKVYFTWLSVKGIGPVWIK